jgi:hypothetical protein
MEHDAWQAFSLMKLHALSGIIGAGALLLLTGCITHEETTYRDVDRTPVQFENDRAARLFYETLNKHADKDHRTESKTEVDLPLVFHDKRKVVDGPNAVFNRAVEQCDTNHDGRITEREAQIFADNRGH